MAFNEICTGDVKDTKDNKDMKRGKDLNNRGKIMKSTYDKENKGKTGRNQIIRPTYVGILRGR